jgi:hypothetical protein
MHLPKNELVPCYHCRSAISFAAVTCHQLGSREPDEPYVFSRKEIRQRVAYDLFGLAAGVLIGFLIVIAAFVAARRIGFDLQLPKFVAPSVVLECLAPFHPLGNRF